MIRFIELTADHVMGFILLGIAVLVFGIVFAYWADRKSDKDLRNAIDDFNKDRRKVKVK